MSDIQRLHTHLTRLGRHLRWRDALRLAAYTLGSALFLAVLIQVAARWWPLPDRHLWAALPLEIWLLGVALYSLLRPLTLWQIAHRLDRELCLKDRLATALELEEWKTGRMEDWAKPSTFQPSNLPALQLSDALSIAQRLTPSMLAWRIPRRPLGWAGGLLAFTLLLAILPNPMDAILAQQAAIRAAAQKQAEAVEEARRELEKSTDPTAEERAEALRALAELMKELSANPGDLEQALADLAAGQSRLRDLQDSHLAARQSAAEQIAAQLTTLARGATRQSSDLNEAASALTELAVALGAMDAASQAELAEALESMAAQAAPTDADLAEALLNMAQAARAGDVGQAVQAAAAAQRALTRSDQAADLQQALAQAQARLENSRQQLAQQGALAQGQSQGQGQGQGQAQAPGQGQGQGQQVGSGGGSNANQLPPANRTGAASAPTQPNKPATVTDAEKVYAPGQGQQLTGKSEFVAGQEGSTGETIIREEQVPQGGATNPSLVPYREVYQNYADAAAEAIEQERIPAEMRDLVRDYFSQLAPE
jgi:septal ring factor EnvC (AmiA/AmiB activator)